MATLCIEGFGGFVASTAAPIATGWSDQVAGRDLHPLKIRAFSRRTRKYTLRSGNRITFRFAERSGIIDYNVIWQPSLLVMDVEP